MKKRAVISTVASVALAGVMCVGFAACADKAESMKGEEVDKATWEAAFAAANFENVKIEMKSSLKAEMEGQSYKESEEGELIIADGKAYYKMHAEASGEGEEETEDVEQYESKAEGDVIIYTKNDAGNWAVNDDEYSMAFSGVNQYIALASQYEMFEYSADKKGYVMKAGAGEGVSLSGLGAVYKFQNGKLAAIWAEVDASMNGASTKGSMSVIFTYGGQSVTLPTVA